MMSVLDKIHSPQDMKNLSSEELKTLVPVSAEIAEIKAERDRAGFISRGIDEYGGEIGRPVRKGRQRNKERGQVDEEQKKGRHDERDERDRPCGEASHGCGWK